ncbi:DUF5988 family protein [Kitasatospora terrestris]|uniref:Thioesterase domain-containing protein n=1 Tax=Kitasatospora terrestris TaxID=258051 RepID=A0ABP9DMA7_9ACTN
MTGTATATAAPARPRVVEDPALRVIAFHHAGGSAAVYHPMARWLPTDWELLLVDLPGRGKRHQEEPEPTLDGAVAAVLPQLEPWLDRPFALFGHSLGALVAFEAARALEAAGRRPHWVGVSGRVAPSFQAHTRRGLYRLGDAELLDELLAMGGTPDRIREVPEFVERFLRTSRADLRAAESYAPHPDRRPLAAPLTAFHGFQDPWAPTAMVAAWERETTGAFRRVGFPGGHFYFLGGAFPELARAVAAEAREPFSSGLPHDPDSQAVQPDAQPWVRRSQMTQNSPNAVLVGGPEAIPEDQRIRYVPDRDGKVKVPWRAGYEHFVATADRRTVGGSELGVFAWAGRTAIAE